MHSTPRCSREGGQKKRSERKHVKYVVRKKVARADWVQPNTATEYVHNVFSLNWQKTGSRDKLLALLTVKKCDQTYD